MAISVNWHNDAIRDLTEIVDYFESAGEVQAAFVFREKMMDRIDFIYQNNNNGS
jgi:plasmid stabilization system protein ParE